MRIANTKTWMGEDEDFPFLEKRPLNYQVLHQSQSRADGAEAFIWEILQVTKYTDLQIAEYKIGLKGQIRSTTIIAGSLVHSFIFI